MRIRTTLTALMLAAMPLAAADPGPQAVLQTTPVGRILQDVRAAAHLVAGEIGSKSIDDGLKNALGEKGFSGLDLSRPVLGYIVFDEKEAMKSSFVALVPITKEEDFLDLLKRAGREPEEDKDKKGLWKLGSFEIPQDEKPLAVDVLMRIDGKTAYIAFNLPADKFDVTKCFKAEQLLDPKETSLLSYKQFNERIPEAVLKDNQKALTGMLTKIKEALDDAGAKNKPIADAIDKIAESIVRISLTSKEFTQRVLLDAATGEFGLEQVFVPKPGTLFAKAVAARKPPVNQFAGLANETTAAGLMFQLPNGFQEIQDLMVAGLEKLQEELKNDPPPPFVKDIMDEFVKGLIRTAKSGHGDFAATINGPDKDGHFTAAAAMQFEDALPIEKAIKASHPNFPVEAKDIFKFDVDKIGQINVHTIDPPEFEESYGKIFGDRKIYFAFGPKGIYAAVGNGAKDALKLALEGKPKEADPFAVLANPKRISQVFGIADAHAGNVVEKALGNEDKTISAMAFTIHGGDALKLKFTLNLKILPRAIAHFALQAFGG